MKGIHAVAGALLLSMGLLAGCETLEHIFSGGGGPAPGGGGGAPRACNGSTCQIDILTKTCASGTCWDLAAIDTKVHVGKSRNVHLIWTAPSGYGFCAGTSDGIAFPPNNQMTDGYPSANGTTKGGNGQHPKFHWKDANSETGEFPYTIRFHASGDCSGKAVELDPVIINDM